MDIAAGLTATRATVDLAKLLMDKLSTPDVDVHNVRMKLQEMLIHAVNAQIALGEVQESLHIAEEKNRQLKRQIEKLADSQAVTASLVFGDEVYLRKKEDGTFEGPFCPACWDIDGKLVRLKLEGIDQYGGCPDRTPCRKYECIVHKITFFISSFKFRDTRIG